MLQRSPRTINIRGKLNLAYLASDVPPHTSRGPLEMLAVVSTDAIAIYAAEYQFQTRVLLLCVAEHLPEALQNRNHLLIMLIDH